MAVPRAQPLDLEQTVLLFTNEIPDPRPQGLDGVGKLESELEALLFNLTVLLVLYEVRTLINAEERLILDDNLNLIFELVIDRSPLIVQSV